jgi:hypothetical protein
MPWGSNGAGIALRVLFTPRRATVVLQTGFSTAEAKGDDQMTLKK